MNRGAEPAPLVVASAAGGAALRGLFDILTRIRHPRPIHSVGVLLSGRITWRGPGDSGLAWVDEPPQGGAEPVIARLSRSVGTPAPLPDVIGLALIVGEGERQGHLELASTGARFPSRFWLAPQRSPSAARLTTLLPYRGERGPVLLGARTDSPLDLPADPRDQRVVLRTRSWLIGLHWATPRSPWRRFADLELRGTAAEDGPDLRFDAVRHPLPGVATYPWTRRLREPSYVRVQDELAGGGVGGDA